jgi:hypothetical protein
MKYDTQHQEWFFYSGQDHRLEGQIILESPVWESMKSLHAIDECAFTSLFALARQSDQEDFII